MPIPVSQRVRDSINHFVGLGFPSPYANKFRNEKKVPDNQKFEWPARVSITISLCGGGNYHESRLTQPQGRDFVPIVHGDERDM